MDNTKDSQNDNHKYRVHNHIHHGATHHDDAIRHVRHVAILYVL